MCTRSGFLVALARGQYPLAMPPKVKELAGRPRRRGTTTISSQHQLTIPAAALRDAGLQIGERLVARVDGPGRLVFEREDDVVAKLAGTLTGVYSEGELEALRQEWD